jgi:hypothetical protein
MNTNFTTKELAQWVELLKDIAEQDFECAVTWFKPTQASPISIVGGWQGGNYPGVNDDLFCTSKKHPDQIMCIKIIINPTPNNFADFETLKMPVDIRGDVDDTCLMLEWDDDSERVATFFLGEWIRMMETWECGGYC